MTSNGTSNTMEDDLHGSRTISNVMGMDVRLNETGMQHPKTLSQFNANHSNNKFNNNQQALLQHQLPTFAISSLSHKLPTFSTPPSSSPYDSKGLQQSLKRKHIDLNQKSTSQRLQQLPTHWPPGSSSGVSNVQQSSSSSFIPSVSQELNHGAILSIPPGRNPNDDTNEGQEERYVVRDAAMIAAIDRLGLPISGYIVNAQTLNLAQQGVNSISEMKLHNQGRFLGSTNAQHISMNPIQATTFKVPLKRYKY